MGYSKMQIAEYGNTYSNMLYDTAATQEDLANKTTKLLEAAAIIRAKTGLRQEEVSQRIRSAMNQEADGADELGINVRTAAVEHSKAFQTMAHGVKNFSDLNSGMQKAIMLQYILDETTRRYGTTLADNVATKQAVFIASLADLKLHIGQAFLPIWNAALPALSSLINWLDVAVQKVAAFMRVLFGFKGSDTASATQKQTNAFNAQTQAVDKLADAKKKAASVAGFDEVNQLAQADSGGAGAATPASTPAAGGGLPSGGAPGADTEGMFAGAEKAAQKVKELWGQVTSFVTSNFATIISTFAGIGGAIASFAIMYSWPEILAVITTSFEALCAVFAVLTSPMVLVAAAIGVIIGALVNLYMTNESFRNSVNATWHEIWGTITSIWSDIWTIVKSTWDKYGTPIMEGLKTAFDGVKKIIKQLWDDYVQPMLITGIKKLKQTWDEHFKPLFTVVTDFAGLLIDSALKIFNKFIVPLTSWLLTKLAPVFNTVFSTAMDVVFGLLGTFADVAKGIFTALGGIVKFVTGVFTGDWGTAWDGVKQVFKGVWDSLEAVAKAPLNAIIDLVNGVISGLNKITIPDWVPGLGGKGISIPTIPRLAKGGITSGPMYAMIGDNPGGQEVVSPLNKLQDYMAGTVSSAITTALAFNNGGGNRQSGDIILNIDGRQFARIIQPYSDMENKRVGGSNVLISAK
jgi:hypothetical protein